MDAVVVGFALLAISQIDLVDRRVEVRTRNDVFAVIFGCSLTSLV